MMENELPLVTPEAIGKADVNDVLEALDRIDELFRAPLVLFHLKDLSYKEIAATLDIPVGTVMSRIARGRDHLFRMLADHLTDERSTRKVIEFPKDKSAKPKKLK